MKLEAEDCYRENAAGMSINRISENAWFSREAIIGTFIFAAVITAFSWPDTASWLTGLFVCSAFSNCSN